MKQTTLKFAGLALATVFAAMTTRAEVAIHQNASIYGYVAASLQYNQHGEGDNSSTKLDLDAAKLGFAFNFAPLTAKVSLYSTSEKIYFLEVNGTYDAGNGLSFTGGRFLTWFGYEPFDIPNGNFITYGNEISGLIPNFHEGVRVDYKLNENMTFGAALVDSLYNRSDDIDDKFSGDGSYSDGYGVELHFGYEKGALLIGATAGYQKSKEGQWPGWKDVYIGDVWAQYTIKNTTLAAEVYYLYGKKDGDDVNANLFLVSAKQKINDNFAVSGRVSYGKVEDSNYWKVSVCPAWALTQNLSVAAEVSYSKYNESDFKNNTFAGVQACFKF